MFDMEIKKKKGSVTLKGCSEWFKKDKVLMVWVKGELHMFFDVKDFKTFNSDRETRLVDEQLGELI